MKYFRIHKTYLLLALLLFIIEVCIAVFIKDRFIRPYFGDVLVVMLIYCFIKGFFAFPILPTVISVLLFSFLIEALQYVDFARRLGLGENKFAVTVLGNSFAWEDIYAYIAGGVIILIAEYFFRRKN